MKVNVTRTSISARNRRASVVIRRAGPHPRPGDELTLVRPDTVSRYVEVRMAPGTEGWVYTPRIHMVASAPPMGGPPEVYRSCAIPSSAQHGPRRELNRLKNRLTAPEPDDVDPAATRAAMLAPGAGRAWWNAVRAATITGFMVDVKAGGRETVNCGEKEELYGDSHIELALQQAVTAMKRRGVVEITSPWREFVRPQGADGRPTRRASWDDSFRRRAR